MTERTKLRNQVTGGVGLGIYSTLKVFWNPWVTSADLRWPLRILSATAACAFFHLAWTKCFEYRAKYPRQSLFKRR